MAIAQARTQGFAFLSFINAEKETANVEFGSLTFLSCTATQSFPAALPADTPADSA